MPPERLQKILSRAGISSRRKAEELIAAGKVAVNDRVVRELGSRADPAVDKISVAGKRLVLSGGKRYYAYYKPRGLVVSKSDELGRKTIFDLLRVPKSCNTAGRLDKDSEGLLLLSDDGDWLQRYTHPSGEVAKIYHVHLSRQLTSNETERLKSGMVLDGKKVRAVRVRIFRKHREPWLELELREGVKREIRRMLEILGVRVRRLIRVQHGSVRLGLLQPGEIMELKHRPD
jgi:23S rRNA pseudouridine2605 synthase